ncbi:MAG: putative bifunctional diguanylate cyclase/phosphodiesterase [Nocardioidaceae bacterium]
MSLGESVSASPMSVVGAPAGIAAFEWTPATEDLWWDGAAGAIFQSAPGESPLETWRRRVHPDDARRVLSTFSGFALAEDVCRLVMDDGSTRRLLLRATHVARDAAGAPYKLGGVALDVSNTRDLSMRVLSMLDSISDGFVTLDPQFRCTYMNRRAEEILAMPREEVVGRHLWEVFPAGTGSEFDQVYRRVMRDRVPETLEAYYPEPLNMWIEVRAQPSAEGLTLYFQDATRHRTQRLERERLLAAERRAREDAEQARAATERALRLVAHQATHDALTGLVNRLEFSRIAEQHLEDLDAAPATAMFLDLDRFKAVNDTLGHAAGDALLVRVAGRLRDVVGRDHVLARLGGDEFVVLVLGHEAQEVEALANRVLAALRAPLDVHGRSLTTSASIGLAPATPGATVETLLRDADVALYRAKDHGRDQVAWFDREAHEELVQRIALEHDLRGALDVDGEGLRLHYQPMYDVANGRIVGVEALCRWEHPRLGPVAPGLFVPLAEDTGLMRTLGAQVITAACSRAADWGSVPDFTVWVNVSARQLDVPGLAEFMLGEIERAGTTPGRIGVEVTESVMSDERCALTELTRLAGAGVRIAIDDFGTGHSSLARLYRFPIDVLKIDQSFVHDIETNRGMAAVRAVVQLTEALGLSTVAEGIETPRQLELVREAGCQGGPGSHLARPTPAESVTTPRRLYRPGVEHPRTSSLSRRPRWLRRSAPVVDRGATSRNHRRPREVPSQTPRRRGYDDAPPHHRPPRHRRRDRRAHLVRPQRPAQGGGTPDLHAGRRLLSPCHLAVREAVLRRRRPPVQAPDHRHPRRDERCHRARTPARRERCAGHTPADRRGQTRVRLGPSAGHPPRRRTRQRAAQRAHLARRLGPGQPDAGEPAQGRPHHGPRQERAALLPGHRARRGARGERPQALLRARRQAAAGDRGLLRAPTRAGGVGGPHHLVRLSARLGEDGAPPPPEGRGPTRGEGAPRGGFHGSSLPSSGWPPPPLVKHRIRKRAGLPRPRGENAVRWGMQGPWLPPNRSSTRRTVWRGRSRPPTWTPPCRRSPVRRSRCCPRSTTRASPSARPTTR